MSFDPGGFVTVDKPPLGFWIETASAKLFGFGGFPRGGPPPGATGGNPPRFPGGNGRGFFRRGAGGDTAAANSPLLRYLERNQGTTKFLLAVSNANSAAPYILATGNPVMALGGFIGSDHILTTSQLAHLVRTNVVRYFMVSGGFGGRFGGPGGDSNGGISTWVQSTCKTVPSSAYQNSASTRGFGGQGGFGGQQLYDCRGK